MASRAGDASQVPVERKTHLAGEQLEDEVTVALHLRRAGPGLQLEPGVVAGDWDLLWEGEEPVRGNPCWVVICNNKNTASHSRSEGC